MLLLCYMACGQWIACFLGMLLFVFSIISKFTSLSVSIFSIQSSLFPEGYCWTRTAERQASTLRARYLKAVLRQEVGYFDLHVTSTADVIESVSSDSLVIQEVISEKVEGFIIF